jgi:hypothetical protein
MTTVDERQTLRELAEEKGWQHRDRGRVDIFSRAATRIRVIWQGDSAISGASIFQDDMMTHYTRALGEVTGWLKR